MDTGGPQQVYSKYLVLIYREKNEDLWKLNDCPKSQLGGGQMETSNYKSVVYLSRITDPW